MQTAEVRLLLLLFLALGVSLASGPLRRQVVTHPRRVLATIVLFDVGWLLWAVVPFVPNGYDEAQFLGQAQRLLGADLDNRWIRTPLPVLMIAASPWHPAVPGILAKQLATIFAYRLARPALGVAMALLAALLTSVSSVLVGNTCQVLSEPYGAAAFAGFALACVAGGPTGLFTAATFGFLCRWQLLWLLPLAVLFAWRRHRLRSVLVGTLLAAGVVAVVIWVVGADPLRTFLQEKERTHTVFERLVYYLSPRTGLGLGVAALAFAAVGAVAIVRDPARDPRLVVCMALFVVHVVAVVAMGVMTRRFMAPAVPLGCVLAAAGVWHLGRRWPHLRRPVVACPALVTLVVMTAVPVPQPRSRELKLGSPQAEVCADLATVRALVGTATLYSDVDTLMLEAILGQRCRAVGEGHSDPEPAAIAREQVPADSLYLTFDAADRAPLWSGRRLRLVRW